MNFKFLNFKIKGQKRDRAENIGSFIAWCLSYLFKKSQISTC
jgi:hypothetical protein